MSTWIFDFDGTLTNVDLGREFSNWMFRSGRVGFKGRLMRLSGAPINVVLRRLAVGQRFLAWSYGLSDIEQMGSADFDTELNTEIDSDKTSSPKKNIKNHKISKTKSLKMNQFQKLMWAGDSPVPNVLKVKYVIVESYRKNNLQTQKNHAIVNCDKTLNPTVKDAVTDFLNFVHEMVTNLE